jgi:CDP-glycerol glycerophosphotransferase (TagB/SpsB family)
MVTTDEQAPKFLTIEIKDDEGKVWGLLQADAKTFATGSCGFHAQGKLTNQKTQKKYQTNLLFTLVGSKPPK